MNPLAVTQRERIRQHNEQEKLQLEERKNETKVEDVHIKIDKSSEKRKKDYFLPKCLMFLLAIMALLAGVVVLVYLFRDKTSVDGLRGNVTKDAIPVEECQGTSVKLGDKIEIKCNFSKPIPEEVTAIYKNSNGAKISEFECVKPIDDKIVTCTAKNKASCSSHGDVEIRFHDSSERNKKIKSTKTVRVNVTAADSALATSIKQLYMVNSSEPQFHLTCHYSGDCSNNAMKFYSTETDLADVRRECTETYSDKGGYNTTCNALISSQVMFEHGNGFVLSCQIIHDNKQIKEREFTLPPCTNIDDKIDCRPNTTTLYDCDDLGQTIDNCTNACHVMNECFPSLVMETSTNSSSCDKECELGWCRREDTKEIDTNGKLSFEILCERTSLH